MTANPTSVTVEGESIDLLLRALSKFRFEGERDGMVQFTVKLPPGLGQPFMRALMRVEAEFLLGDADALGSGGEERTHGQRGLDALIELARRATAAVG